jgi:nucleolar protein 9
MDPFASHVVRTLLTLLVPSLSSSDRSNTGPHGAPLRSKKSAAYKARQGPMKSVFKSAGDNDGSRDSTTSILTPPEFGMVARRFVHTIRTEMDDNEIRALASDKVASPVLQVLFCSLMWDSSCRPKLIPIFILDDAEARSGERRS